MERVVEPREDPVLARTLAAAELPATGRFHRRAGWVSRAWIGDEVVVRVTSDTRHRDAFRHEARVVRLLAGSDVPHARRVAHGDGPDGPWYVSERLRGTSLHEAWRGADVATRRALVESLASALQALHRVPAPPDLLPPWLAAALDGVPWPAFHPPVVGRTLELVEAARRRPDHDARLLDDVAARVRELSALFVDDEPVLVHGDLHGSNVVVDGDRVTGLVDFAESLAQPADAELDTVLRWCARAQEFPPTPDGQGLDPATLTAVPGWLRGAYPQLFAHPRLRDRLATYDLFVELAIHAHHPDPGVRAAAARRTARVVSGHGHLAALAW
ncbi:phosphotransferase [Kineococcus endophyticus]|uniref:Phosphotransferase n=1 Tax=Kineococcus endophyticus TaxID=1181883 RepID=A0ABV3PCA4_9ACTN